MLILKYYTQLAFEGEASALTTKEITASLTFKDQKHNHLCVKHESITRERMRPARRNNEVQLALQLIYQLAAACCSQFNLVTAALICSADAFSKQN